MSPRAPLGSESPSDLSCLWGPGQLGRVGQAIYGVSLCWVLTRVFLVIRLESWEFGRETAEVWCHSHPILSKVILSL